MSVLVKQLTERKKRHSECQKELVQREKASGEVCEERDELRAKMDDRSRECVHLNQTKDRLEADLAVSHEKLHTLHLEVRSRDQFILQLRAEMKTAEQKHERKQEQVAALEGEVRHLKREVRGHHEEMSQLSERVRDMERLIDQKEKEQQQLHDQLRDGQQQVETFEGKQEKQELEMEFLQQQLRGAKEQLKDASLQAQEKKETVAIFRQKYTAAMEKVHRVQGQVELLEEELQYSQQQLGDAQVGTHSVKEELAEMEQRYREKVGQWEFSQEALDQLTDELQANQDLWRESQQKADHLKGLAGSLQEQVDTLKQQKAMLECDLQLYQQSHSHADEEFLRQLRHRQQLQKRCTEQVERLAECEKAILQMKSELERQVQEKGGLKQSLLASHHTHTSDRSRLEQEVVCLELELADTQKVHVALLRQSEEELKEAVQEAARRSSEVDVQRGEAVRLQEELLKGEEKASSAIREKQSLSARIRQLSQELEELRSKLQVTVEELAARAEEARRMEGSLNEGKLAEGKIRSMAARMETEVAELTRNLHQAVDHKLSAEREKREAQEQVDTLRSELQGTRSDYAHLRHESQLVMTNVDRWISEQKVSNESLIGRMKARQRVLLLVTEEKTMEKQSCVALNLSKIEDMHNRLRSNLEAIGMLNQQLNSLSGENKRLCRRLQEERSMRRQVERLLPPPPPTFQQCSSVYLPLSLSACPPPPSTSLLSSLRLPPPLSPGTATGDIDGILTQTKLSRAGLERPGECEALGEAFRIRPPASLEDAPSGRTSRDQNK
ncbi:polyamine-modulated factor 1-binding protein 1 isoform X4 [Cottoperca gobio]|uniref:Polyamine-modulated factor 1-binding protein 1 isoform X4 n=1 Tax=Cottoperca gobio TaxID=56716 RepID=A0A6J2RUZ4_COTGO|nr:polyamine-modulated factor 1-binding protein 1-like isoform X4 [Cottoperca gobio]